MEASYFKLPLLADEIHLYQNTIGWVEKLRGTGGVFGSTIKMARWVQFTAAGLGLAATWYATQGKDGNDKGAGGEGSDEGGGKYTNAIIEGSKAIETVATAAAKIAG